MVFMSTAACANQGYGIKLVFGTGDFPQKNTINVISRKLSRSQGTLENCWTVDETNETPGEIWQKFGKENGIIISVSFSAKYLTKCF